MKVNLKSNIPNVIPTIKVCKLSDMNIGDAFQIALGYMVGDKVSVSEFKILDKSYLQAIVFQKGVEQDVIKVVLISNLSNRIDSVNTFAPNTPVIPLDCEINFRVNYNLDNNP